MASSSKSTARCMSQAAWNALLNRDLEYAINVLVAGCWVDDDGKVKDGYGSLDARIGSERCQETAILALIFRKQILEILDDNKLKDIFVEQIATYRSNRANDKLWNKCYTPDDVTRGIENAPLYDKIKKLITDTLGEQKTNFLGWARTLTSFSVLSDCPFGFGHRYRRLGNVMVETTQEQRDNGMGDLHDAEFPLRSRFSKLSCALLEELADEILGDDVKPQDFGTEPQPRDTLPEQLREMYHFSICQKINPGHPDYPIYVGSFSASMDILLRASWKYDLFWTMPMPRLEHVGHKQSSFDGPAEPEAAAKAPTSEYRVKSVPVITYIPSAINGGSYTSVNTVPEKYKNEPCWRLGGFSIYNKDAFGQRLRSSDNEEYEQALRKCDGAHITSLFGEFHNEYPGGVLEPVDLVALVRKVCTTDNGVQRTLEETKGAGMDPNDKSNTAGKYGLSLASAIITNELDLYDTFIARQVNQAARSCYEINGKHIPFTFNHIDISTREEEEVKWKAILTRNLDAGQPVYRYLFTIGNSAYSCSDMAIADRLMKMNNANLQMELLFSVNPGQRAFFDEEMLRRYDQFKRKKEEKAAKAAKLGWPQQAGVVNDKSETRNGSGCRFTTSTHPTVVPTPQLSKIQLQEPEGKITRGHGALKQLVTWYSFYLIFSLISISWINNPSAYI